MLVSNIHEIGSKMLFVRKKAWLTQADVAERAGLSDRTYADIERGETNMRVETLLRICKVLKITPDEVLSNDDYSHNTTFEEIIYRIQDCPPKNIKTAAKLLSVYLDSIE